MPDPFDGRRYLAHLRAHWLLPTFAVAAAVAISGGASLLLPKKYTARVKMIIEPPAGSDVRVSTAVSPIYLESLRTYEHFASSDQLFAQAVERFKLREGASPPFEKLKRQVLRVSIPRNTKVMEIAATLPDPRQARAVALYLAEATIDLNRRTNRAGDDELLEDVKKQLEEAAQRLATAESAYFEARRLLRSQEEPAFRAASAQTGPGDRAPQVETARAELDAASALHQLAEKRIRELTAASGFRGERLNLIDPGVTPEQPSSPDILLNVILAVALALLLSLLYLTAQYSLRSERAEAADDRDWMATRP
jgi:uncharacterized protein involved in exopolysaccharide biosynthesis